MLSNYWREKIMSRRLRIRKFPSFRADDSEFKDKWEAILNKCSLDLMLLLIEEAKKQKSHTQNEMANLKEVISKSFKEQQQKKSCKKVLIRYIKNFNKKN